MSTNNKRRKNIAQTFSLKHVQTNIKINKQNIRSVVCQLKSEYKLGAVFEGIFLYLGRAFTYVAYAINSL